MKQTRFLGISLIVVFILSSCAGNFKSINPQSFSFSKSKTERDLEVAYQYDILHLTENKKYRRKAYEANVNLVAVKLTNPTDSVLEVDKHIIFYHGNTPIDPMEPEIIKNKIKQNTTSYLFYLFFTSVQLAFEEDGASIPIGWILGPALAGSNMAIAGGSNIRLLTELRMYSLNGKSLQPGQSIRGIIGISNMGYSPITAEIYRAD
jgi:hypothetical protein